MKRKIGAPSVRENLNKVQVCIREAAEKCGRNPDEICLVAVTKTVPVNIIREAIDAGAGIFGENYVQEAKEKIMELSSKNASWHFIGGLQSNKAKYVVKMFNLIHSVDSVKLLTEIDKQAKKIDKIQDILIQVNIAGENQKSGVSPEKTFDLLEKAGELENVAVKGLMTMPPYFDEPEKARPFFRKLRQLRDQCRKKLAGRPGVENVSLKELSMGMTGDFEAAIEEGATMVRIGTAIFGSRR